MLARDYGGLQDAGAICAKVMWAISSRISDEGKTEFGIGGTSSSQIVDVSDSEYFLNVTQIL